MTDRTRRWLWLALRLGGTAAGLAYIAFIADLRQVADTLVQVPLSAFALALTMSMLSVMVAAARWRVMFRTYGAAQLPGYGSLLRLQLVGLFYSTYLPGGVGGDLVRGVASRRAFGDSGTPAALTVVAVERLVGLAALLALVSAALYLRPLGPRVASYDVLSGTRIDEAGARALAEATERCWAALMAQDIAAFGAAVRESFEAQIAMFPHMVTPEILTLIKQYEGVARGWKLSGAGGGGYLVLVADRPIEHAVRVVVRRVAD